jgi:tRNA G10  N-methylase Trm11
VYTLSFAELLAVFNKADPALGLADNPITIVDASYEVLIIESQKPLQTEKLQRRLGGCIKILEVCDVLKKREFDSVNFALQHYFKPSVLKKQFLKDYKGKIQFGVSIYLLDEELAKRPERTFEPNPKGPRVNTNNIFIEPKKIGMMIKNTLTEGGLSVRLVLPEMNSLSLASVAVTGNLLLQKGAEICILAGKEKLYIAKTLTVQDFEDYGRRDYQRPVRDEKQGMIPPKVAQVMLNLANCKSGDTVLDPFCGIGTIVQEGLLLGFRMIGSDLNKIAVRGSEQNLEWFRNRYKIAPGKYGLETSDATKVSGLIEKSGHKINAVVTECTLGPIYSEYPKNHEIKKNFEDLTKLYIASFQEFSKFLPSGAKIVMCIPAYRKGRDSYEMNPNLDFAAPLGYNFISLIPSPVAKKHKFLKLTERGTAIYDRKDQVVAREICIFEKN